MSLPYLESLGDGVHAVDTGFHRRRFDAAYLMVERGRAAFIDTGTNFAVPRLLAALHHLGLTPDDVDWVIPSHVHLDHAGGAGLLMQHLPRARLAVHARGVRHMVDPSALYEGSLAIYGQDEMDRSYGRLVPVPADRVLATEDGTVLELAGRPLLCMDTPGHARHHHCIWDARSRCWFTGDTFGLSYRDFDNAKGAWIAPSSTPVQFEPEPLKASIRRMLDYGPAGMCLTHYSRVGDVPRLASLLIEQIDAMVAMAREADDGGDARQQRLRRGLRALYDGQLQRHGWDDREPLLDRLALDIELNAQGLGIWLDREAKARQAGATA